MRLWRSCASASEPKLSSVDWSAVRAEFPALREWTYLNTATFGQLSKRSVGAVQKHFEHRDELACSDFLDWFDDVDRVRESIAKLIGAKASDIAFVTNAASGLALFLEGFDWRPGDRVVTLEHEFPNNLYAAEMLARHGATLEVVEWKQVPEALKGARAFVASLLNYVTGFRLPLPQLSSWCRERGVISYVDATQGLGAVQVDFASTPIDVMTVHGYKWMLAPNGAAFAYISESMRERLRPNVVGWRSDHAWREVDALHHGLPRFAQSAEKFEGGMVNFANLFALGASVDLMLELGPQVIEARVLELAGKTRAVLERAGAVIAHENTPILAARFEGLDVSALAGKLRDRRILVSARHGNLRVSTHFYNDEEDIARLAEGLQA
jgi:cysteine desulfurase / selenocysteine lyase